MEHQTSTECGFDGSNPGVEESTSDEGRKIHEGSNVAETSLASGAAKANASNHFFIPLRVVFDDFLHILSWSSTIDPCHGAETCCELTIF